jgi:lipopolysaccharide biosynthesis regulator YciM
LQAEVAYQKAAQINEKSPQAWKGLAELYQQTEQWHKAAEAFQTLVSAAKEASHARRVWQCTT